MHREVFFQDGSSFGQDTEGGEGTEVAGGHGETKRAQVSGGEGTTETRFRQTTEAQRGFILKNHRDTEGTERNTEMLSCFLEGTEAAENTNTRVGGETNERATKRFRRPQRHEEMSF